MKRHYPSLVGMIIAIVIIGSLIVLFVFQMLSHSEGDLAVDENCSISQGTNTWTLTPTQADYAALIARVGINRGIERRGVAIAIAVAQTESKLSNPTNGDLDSIGLFQQRPSMGWGTAEELADPYFAADAFYSELEKLDYKNGGFVDIADQVQKSAYPDRVESYKVISERFASGFFGKIKISCSLSALNFDSSAAQKDLETLKKSLIKQWGIDSEISEDSTYLKATFASEQDEQKALALRNWLVCVASDRKIMEIQLGDMQWNRDTSIWGSASSQNSDSQESNLIISLKSGVI